MDVDASPAAVLLAGFRSWLVAERGLSPETVRCYCNQVSSFLASLPEPVDSSVQQLDSGRVTSFMVGHCQGRTGGRPRRWRPRCVRCCGICTCAGTHRPGWSARFRAWRAGGWRGCWARVTARPWWAAATTRFCSCWRGWDYAAARSPDSNSATSIGAAAKSLFAARLNGSIGYHFRSMSVRRLWRIWPTADRPARHGRCSAPSGHPAGR
jgi:hypothetical protein